MFLRWYKYTKKHTANTVNSWRPINPEDMLGGLISVANVRIRCTYRSNQQIDDLLSELPINTLDCMSVTLIQFVIPTDKRLLRGSNRRYRYGIYNAYIYILLHLFELFFWFRCFLFVYFVTSPMDSLSGAAMLQHRLWKRTRALVFRFVYHILFFFQRI